MSRRDRPIRASDLAEMGFCETKCVLKAKHGDQSTPEADRARRGGSAAHVRFHEQVTAFHNQAVASRGGRAKDRRCYIASAVYGIDDPRTEELRSFRDIVLLPTRTGRFMVRVYYAVSPWIVAIAGDSRSIRIGAAWILDYIRRRIAPANRKEASHEQSPPAVQGQHPGD